MGLSRVGEHTQYSRFAKLTTLTMYSIKVECEVDDSIGL